MKKSTIDGDLQLDYLWELGELPVYIIGGLAVSVSQSYDGLSQSVLVHFGGENVPVHYNRSVRGRSQVIYIGEQEDDDGGEGFGGEEGGGGVKKLDPPLLPPSGQGRRGGPYNHNAGEG